MSNVGRERAPEAVVAALPRVRRQVRPAALTASTAMAAFGPLVEGYAGVCLSKGRVSFGDTVAYVLEALGQADVWLTTWTIAGPEIRGLRALVDSGTIRQLRLITDPSFARRHRAYMAQLRGTFGAECVRLVACHAKTAAIVSTHRAFVIFSSANLNAAHRCEFYLVEESRELAAFLIATWQRWFAAPANLDASAAQHAEAFHAWGAPAAAGDAQGGDRGRRRPVRRPAARVAPAALQAGTPEDAAFFSDDPFGVDLRRVGASYL